MSARSGEGGRHGPPPVALLAFVWLELVAPDRTDPRMLGIWPSAYAVVQLGAGLVRGGQWFARGDGSEVYSHQHDAGQVPEDDADDLDDGDRRGVRDDLQLDRSGDTPLLHEQKQTARPLRHQQRRVVRQRVADGDRDEGKRDVRGQR